MANKREKKRINFEAVEARYVRMFGFKRALEWGFSIWEFKVFGQQKSESMNAKTNR